MPVVEEFSGDDTVVLNWNVEKFSLHTCTMGKPILSPEFEVKELGDSYWRMELYPNGSNNFEYIACLIRAEMEKERFQYESYSFTLSLHAGDTVFFERHETWYPVGIAYWKCDEFIRRDLLRPIHLPRDIFSIRCVIQPGRSDDKRRYLPKFEYLSQNLISLLESEKYSDLVLITDDNMRIKVHKCIMDSRWSNLPDTLRANLLSTGNYLNCGPEIQVPNTNSDTLKTLIRYVYSGTIVRQNVPPDVFNASEELEFETLRKNLTSFSKTYFGVTELTSDHKIVTWHLGDVRFWNTEPLSFTRTLPVTELYEKFDLILVFSIRMNVEGDRAIDIAFCFASLEEGIPLSLHCKMSLSVQNREASAFRKAYHLFQTTDFWHFPQPFKMSDIPDQKRSLVTMEIVISDGFWTCTKRNSETEFFSLTKFRPIRDLQQLSVDLFSMVINENHYPTDCLLECPNLKKYKAHRAILWARWPQLRPVLDASVDEFGAERCIKINIEEDLLADILNYIYSGNPYKIRTRTVLKVLKVNETVPIPALFLAECKDILEKH